MIAVTLPAFGLLAEYLRSKRNGSITLGALRFAALSDVKNCTIENNRSETRNADPSRIRFKRDHWS